MTTTSIQEQFDRHLQQFLEEMEGLRWSPHTRVAYERGVELFFRWLIRETQVTSLREVTTDMIRAYRLTLVRTKIAPSTQTLRLAAVKTFFRFMSSLGVVDRDPASAIDLPRKRAIPVRPQPHLTPEDVERMIASVCECAPFALRDRAVLEVLYASGLRAGELCALDLEDFDAEKELLTVRVGKCAKSRVVPIGPAAAAALMRYVAEERPKLVGPKSGERIFLGRKKTSITRQTVAHIVGEAAHAAGIGKRISPHRLRHACATHMLGGGAQLPHVQKLLGHGSIETTSRYTHVELGDLAQVHRKAHPWGGGGGFIV